MRYRRYGEVLCTRQLTRHALLDERDEDRRFFGRRDLVLDVAKALVRRIVGEAVGHDRLRIKVRVGRESEARHLRVERLLDRLHRSEPRLLLRRGPAEAAEGGERERSSEKAESHVMLFTKKMKRSVK